MTQEDVNKVAKQVEVYVVQRVAISLRELTPMIRKFDDNQVDILAASSVHNFSERKWFDWVIEDDVSVQVIAACSGVSEEKVFSVLRHVTKGAARHYFAEREKRLESLRLVAWQQGQCEMAREKKREAGKVSPKQQAVMQDVREYLDNDPSTYKGGQKAFLIDMKSEHKASESTVKRAIAKARNEKQI